MLIFSLTSAMWFFTYIVSRFFRCQPGTETQKFVVSRAKSAYLGPTAISNRTYLRKLQFLHIIAAEIAFALTCWRIFFFRIPWSLFANVPTLAVQYHNNNHKISGQYQHGNTNPGRHAKPSRYFHYTNTIPQRCQHDISIISSRKNSQYIW